MGIPISPHSMGGDSSGRLDKVERDVNAIQREVDGMHRERIKDANGQVWETLARREAIEPLNPTPFALSVSGSNRVFKFTVGEELSTITDGTNGSMIDLSTVGLGKELDLSGKAYVMIYASIDENLDPTYWYLEATDEKKEVIIVDGKQTEARLLIGKVIYKNGSAEAIQCINDAQRLCHGFLNGVLVRVFESAPVHPDYEPPKN